MRVVVVAVLFGFASVASAHIEMESPAPRFNDGQNKWCPCGGGGDGTRANADCDIDVSDPLDRGSTNTAFAPGEQIVVRFRETVGHSGRMRVAFDPDGSDLDDFNLNILADVADPPGNTGNAGEGNVWEIPVTLPNISCANCSIQLIQVMNGNTTDPVSDPRGFQTYFQCANVSLGVAEGEGEGEGDDTPPPENGGCAASGTALWIAVIALGRASRGAGARSR